MPVADNRISPLLTIFQSNLNIFTKFVFTSLRGLRGKVSF
jgi:hypothetical protein